MPLVHLSEVQSSLVLLLLIVGVGLLLNETFDRRSQWQRALLMAVGMALALRYAWWRATVTLAPFGLTWDCLASWSLFAIELGALLSSISASVLMSRSVERSGEATRHLAWWEPGSAPRVAVLIATYNEDREVLERTIVGAAALDYTRKDVLVLDDGRRDWLREFCTIHGVRHVTRPDNKGAKAGNINHALALLAAEPEPPAFIAVLDADFVPHRRFLDRTLALFHASDVGLVQTPQHFFNADPIQHNLGLSRSYPDEQRFFFDYMQPSRDAWGIPICCGTSSVMRWSAVHGLGGLPTDSITEDFMLTLALQEAGWRTVYLNEALTEGLAPEGLKEYVTQRARWCLGLMQIARSRVGPFARNRLRLVDRWSVVDSVLYWLTTFPFRIAGLIYPLFYWYFGVTVVDARVPDVLSYFGAYFLWTILSFNLLSPGMLVPLLKDVSQHLGSIQISRAAIVGLLRPKGHPFSVTAKGGDRSRIVIQWSLLAPYVVIFALTLSGLLAGLVFDRFAYYDAGDGKAVVLFWTVYNLFVLALCILACIELPRQEHHVADKPERAILVAEGQRPKRVWLASLTQDTARIRGQQLASGTHAFLRIRDVGDVEATVLSATTDGARLHLFPEPEAHAALLRRFYTEGGAPGVGSLRLSTFLEEAAQRLSFNRQQP